LMLEGGMAFGTGEHPTTRLCCNWLQRQVQVSQEEGVGMRVLDYGAGRGVLGLAAIKFGAKEAVGVEIDRDAI
ncbi:ribosomal protein L11 methyltransferase-domain-containing protein, partial [Baffinella frigidus]